MHLSRRLITFSLNLSYFVAKTKTSLAIFTTPSNPSTMFHIHFLKIPVALLRPMVRTLEINPYWGQHCCQLLEFTI